MSGENEVAGHDATSAPEPVKSGMSDTPSIPVAAAQRPLRSPKAKGVKGDHLSGELVHHYVE